MTLENVLKVVKNTEFIVIINIDDTILYCGLKQNVTTGCANYSRRSKYYVKEISAGENKMLVLHL